LLAQSRHAPALPGGTGTSVASLLFELRRKRTEETEGGFAQIRYWTRGTAQPNRGIKRRESIPHVKGKCSSKDPWVPALPQIRQVHFRGFPSL